ncbi:biotin-dependent carboxyltransferase family protein [Variovorax sp. DXTD-1]|uniref:5-oxoprolinase subunit C family protein n=1 Tax=Variovorax sp. DXTD-1 TaxID=2495592 RepID=UPI000F868B35|nr:biotin-dependent carboxyltransferase family protein [Variovorax sp. DXTD-1]RST51631.1 biotin-dependent carboxyltransferase family protein [Variovorax sp. DXTD-1]
MMLVQKPGMLASVQDLGRHGHRQVGICPGGALDVLALTLANRLVGNADGAAGLEITMGGCEIRFETDTRIALAGDDFAACLDGAPVWPCWSMPVAAGQTLKLAGANAPGAKKAGLRSWLAVAGGIDVPLVLGSRSTDLKAGFGGHQGRALRKGDRLALGAASLDAAQLARRPFGLRGPEWGPEQGDSAIELRVLPGPEFDQFTAASHAQLWSERWRITAQSNRMGSRLAGAELKRKRSIDMLSSGVIPGTIQVPPSGQPIILMGDAQTTGGYPRIGVVIRADLWKLAQAPLDGRLRLVQVDMAAALEAWAEQQRYLAQVAQGLAAAGWSRPA